jgi:hypothetical protein
MTPNSLKKLKECHPDLIELAIAVDAVFPIQCICGHRNEEDQNEAVKTKHSKLKWPLSKHNKLPSLAADFVPDLDKNPATISWDNIAQFKSMCKKFEEKAKELGIDRRTLYARLFTYKYPIDQALSSKLFKSGRKTTIITS